MTEREDTLVKVRRIKRLALLAGFLVGSGVLAACASTASNPRDPVESVNRVMFSVNEGVDAVARPVAQGYDVVAPLPVRTGIGNFFGNLADVWIALNNLLQGKGADGFSDLGRFLLNTTVGIGGVFDVAGEMGMEKHAEDFGQTLAVWGVGDGPYLFLPLIGPRTARDTLGFAVDGQVDPVMQLDTIRLRNSLAGIRFVDTRASLLSADKVVDEAAFDKYNYVRDAYLQNRRNAIHDGNPPRVND